MRKIVLILTIIFSYFNVHSQCAEAGADTTVCGFNFGLMGSPNNGEWTYLCSDTTQFLELTGTTAEGIAGVTVAGCGTYSFIYTVDDMTCMDQDTITVSFEDPSSQSRRFEYNISIDYGTHDCPLLQEDTCSNVRILDGAFPPRPFWNIDILGFCDVTYPLAVVSNPDSSNCTAVVNHLGTNKMDTVERNWTSSQDAFVNTDLSQGIIVENRFFEFIQILERGLSQRMDSACYPFGKCFLDDPMCSDTVRDTTVLIMPTHIGGRWNVINQFGTIPLSDSTDFDQDGKRYRLVISPGARYFGPNNIKFTAFEIDQMTGQVIDLDSTADFILFWQEEWLMDTITRVDERLVPNGNCFDCDVHELTIDTLIFPDIPTTFCPTIDVSFNPPIPSKITGDTVLCEGRFVVLGAPEGKSEYLWSNGTTSRFNFLMTPGLVTLETVDSTGCTTADSVTIIAINRPDYMIDGDTANVCDGECLELDIVGDSVISYQWSNLDLDKPTSYCISTDTLIWVEVEDTSGCFYRDSFIIDIDKLFVIDAGEDKIITCDSNFAVLIPDTINLDTVTYFEWDGPGIDMSNRNDRTPSVSEDGTYFLRVGQEMGACLGFDSVKVVFADNRPISEAGENMLINCVDTTIRLDGSNSQSGPNFTLEWSGPGINDMNKTQTRPVVDLPGEYVLFNCNTTTGCCDTDTVNIGLNKSQPRADAGMEATITCDSSTTILGGPATTTGFDIVYLWTGPGINTMNQNELNPTVNQPGTYFLQVTDTVSQCQSIDAVEILVLGVIPVADAGTDEDINCIAPEVTLDASNSVTAPSVKIEWMGPGINGANRNMLSPVVDVEGEYILELRDTLGNCISTDTVQVTNSIRLPDIEAGNQDSIDCDTRGIRLNGVINNDNGNMGVLWTGPGIDMNNQSLISPVVGVGGTYILEVTDTTNSCASLDTVIIVEDFDPAIPNAGPNLNLTCDNSEVRLDASLTNFDPATALFSWEGPDIDFQRMFELNPIVGLPGTYILSINAVNDRCDVSDTMTIGYDTIAPSIVISGDMTVGCNSDTAMMMVDINSGDIRSISWSSTDGNIIGPSNTNQITSDASGRYFVEVIGENGCRTLDSVDIEEWNAYQIEIEVDSTCENMADGFARVLIRGGEFPFSFSLNGGPFSSATSFTGLESGPYTLDVRDRDGCQRTFSFEIKEIPLIPVENEVIERNFCESDNLIIGDNFGILDPQFRWLDNPAANIKRSVQDTGVYILQIFNQCDTADLEYIVSSDLLPENGNEVYRMPNAFTPNNDNLNDSFGPVWQLSNLDEYVFIDYSFDITNRWGELIYSTVDPTDTWDGILDGDPQPGQGYFYRVTVQLEDCKGTRLQFKSEGTMALLR